VKTVVYKTTAASEAETTIEALARVSQLPKTRLKEAMNKGAVWISRGKHSKRLRRSTTVLRQGDTLTLYYNPDILALAPPEPTLIADERHYSVWQKPAGLLAQGSREGDHCSLLRLAEQKLGREVFLVHRLDREASGLMLIAHSSKAAAALSALFAQPDTPGKLQKIYRVEVVGKLPESGSFDFAVDGKHALSRYTLLEYDPNKDRSLLRVELVTGRKHQIRRHFAEANHPVLGDPQYGENNKDNRGLQLQAVELAFMCPLTGLQRHYSLL
jgi:tRNA pseudouridine32 synthase / 23S rRNA pseudouridine746 synthase